MLLSGLLRTYNEERNLPLSLENLLRFCDEVVLSDGGSTDQSRQVALSFGERVRWLDFPGGSISDDVWFNHAGQQLNFGLAHCRSDWVIVGDVDITPCPWLIAHLRDILQGTPHDAFCMYGVHVVQDRFHYASEYGTGPGMVQLFRNRPGISFPDQPEHACHMSHIPWQNLGILQGGVFHYGYIIREQELAKIALRAVAVPKDATYQALSKTPPQHKPLPIPWDRCSPDCENCWMEEMSMATLLERASRQSTVARRSLAQHSDGETYASVRVGADAADRFLAAVLDRLAEIPE